jgi:hypothetical protein
LDSSHDQCGERFTDVKDNTSVVELLAFSLSFMSFFPSFLPSRNISGQMDAFKK